MLCLVPPRLKILKSCQALMARASLSSLRKKNVFDGSICPPRQLAVAIVSTPTSTRPNWTARRSSNSSLTSSWLWLQKSPSEENLSSMIGMAMQHLSFQEGSSSEWDIRRRSWGSMENLPPLLAPTISTDAGGKSGHLQVELHATISIANISPSFCSPLLVLCDFLSNEAMWGLDLSPLWEIATPSIKFMVLESMAWLQCLETKSEIFDDSFECS